MDVVLAKAYEVILNCPPGPDVPDWQLARAVLDHFNVPKLGEDLAKQCVHRIVNHTWYPTHELTTEIVGRAEGLASELWDDLPDEPHMAEIERKEYLELYQTRTKDHDK